MRKTRDLCQQCWESVHPGEYAPMAMRYGTCARCGEEPTLVSRSTLTEETEE